MGLKKILKKVGKGLKKVAKPAALIGAAYLASKALKGKGIDTGLTKGKFLASGAAGGASLAKQDQHAKAVKAMTSNAAYSDAKMPSNITKRARPYKSKKSGWDNWYDNSAGQNLKSGGRAGYKSGGAAKRGFGKEIK